MSEIQLFVISAVATAIVFAVKALSEKGGVTIPRGWLTVGLFVVSVGLAVVWQLPVFDPFPVYGEDVAIFAGQWLTYIIRSLEAISPLVAFATLIYNTLGKIVFEKLAEKIGLK